MRASSTSCGGLTKVEYNCSTLALTILDDEIVRWLAEAPCHTRATLMSLHKAGNCSFSS